MYLLAPHLIAKYDDMPWLDEFSTFQKHFGETMLAVRIVSPQLAARCSTYASWFQRCDFRVLAFILGLWSAVVAALLATDIELMDPKNWMWKILEDDVFKVVSLVPSHFPFLFSNVCVPAAKTLLFQTGTGWLLEISMKAWGRWKMGWLKIAYNGHVWGKDGQDG